MGEIPSKFIFRKDRDDDLRNPYLSPAPGSLAEVEKRFGDAYEHRKKYSPLAAFWHTDIGPLNRDHPRLALPGSERASPGAGRGR